MENFKKRLNIILYILSFFALPVVLAIIYQVVNLINDQIKPPLLIFTIFDLVLAFFFIKSIVSAFINQSKVSFVVFYGVISIIIGMIGLFVVPPLVIKIPLGILYIVLGNGVNKLTKMMNPEDSSDNL